LTQFNSTSLHSHISRTYKFDQFSAGFVEILAAQQTFNNTSWYEGTADAVRKNLVHFLNHDFDYLLILSGDQLYRMDFQEVVEQHRESGADITASGIGAVVATGSATIVNAGIITGGTAGVLLDAGSAVANQASGTISGVIGVYAIGTAATVTNAGRISGSSAAVELAAGFANRLIVDPGASFSGSVDGGNAVGAAPNSTLELASSASGGTLSALGTQFIEVQRAVVRRNADGFHDRSGVSRGEYPGGKVGVVIEQRQRTSNRTAW